MPKQQEVTLRYDINGVVQIETFEGARVTLSTTGDRTGTITVYDENNQAVRRKIVSRYYDCEWTEL